MLDPLLAQRGGGGNPGKYILKNSISVINKYLALRIMTASLSLSGYVLNWPRTS